MNIKLYTLLWFITSNVPNHAAILHAIVPNGLGDIDGDRSSPYPFLNTGIASNNISLRHQQVYDASQFSSIPSNGAYLIWVAFRADCAGGYSSSVSNIEVRLSTTLKSPSTLSAVFSNNIGLDERVVYQSARYSVPTRYRSPVPPYCPPVQSWDGFISFASPFFYNPTKGNLLMEIRHQGMAVGAWEGVPYLIDASSGGSNSTSRVYGSPATATAGNKDNLGLVTYLWFDAGPSLSIYRQTNSINVSVVTYVPGCRIQTATNLGPGALWHDYTNSVETVDWGFIAHFPESFLQPRRYIRAVLDRPTQP